MQLVNYFSFLVAFISLYIFGLLTFCKYTSNKRIETLEAEVEELKSVDPFELFEKVDLLIAVYYQTFIENAIFVNNQQEKKSRLTNMEVDELFEDTCEKFIISVHQNSYLYENLIRVIPEEQIDHFLSSRALENWFARSALTVKEMMNEKEK